MEPRSVVFFVLGGFFGHACSVWKFLGQGSNPCHSSDPGCCSVDDTRSLTHWPLYVNQLPQVMFIVRRPEAVRTGWSFKILTIPKREDREKKLMCRRSPRPSGWKHAKPSHYPPLQGKDASLSAVGPAVWDIAGRSSRILQEPSSTL